MKKHSLYLLLITIAIIGIKEINAQSQYTIPSKMEWWYGARFGMFIHFGSYSYLGHGEWAFQTESYTKVKYQTEVSTPFNPENFDAGTIARLAKRAGMKYLVITAKHHEGFCMWKTDVQSFKDVTGTKLYDLQDFTSFKTRDILKELKDSCDAQGVKFCLYYSILDWNHPSQVCEGYYSRMYSDSARLNYIKDMKAQLSELITRYHPAVLWFDGDWTMNTGSPTLSSWWTKSDGIDLYNYLISIDPNLIVNERVARGNGLGDFECPEQSVPTAPLSRPWETCQTMNQSWGYSSWDNNYKGVDYLIHELVRVVSRDGNYLLNIGPKGDGSVPDEVTTIVNGFENWMKIYSESIYGTTRSPFTGEPKWGFFTKKKDKLFVHVFTWPANGQLKIPYIANTINSIYLANDTSKALSYTKTNDSISITVPANAPNTINSVIVLNVTGIPSVTDIPSSARAADHSMCKGITFTPLIEKGLLHIEQTGNSLLKVMVFNIKGQTVAHLTSNSKTISFDISYLPNGIYTVKIAGREGISSMMFIKK